MQITLTGHHIDITPALRDYVSEKLTRIERHHDQITQIHIVLTVEKLRQTAEATMYATGQTLFADAEDQDMYAAIDVLIDKMDRQLKKHKEKLADKHRTDKVRSYS